MQSKRHINHTTLDIKSFLDIITQRQTFQTVHKGFPHSTTIFHHFMSDINIQRVPEFRHHRNAHRLHLTSSISGMYTHNASQKPTTFTITTDKTTHTDDDVAHAKVHKGICSGSGTAWDVVCINVPKYESVCVHERQIGEEEVGRRSAHRDKSAQPSEGQQVFNRKREIARERTSEHSP